MSLKFVLDSLEGLDDGHKTLYSKHTDGKFYLEVDGAVAKNKVDEFRDNNISLKQKNEELTAKYGSVDLERYNALLEKEANDDGKKRIPLDKVDSIVAERTAAMKAEHQTQIDAAANANSGLSNQLNGLLIDGAVRTAAMDAKVQTGALDDVILRAKQTFQVIEGAAIAHDSNGQVLYSKNGTDPLSTVEWIGGLKTSAPHLFEVSKGGGAGGGQQKPGEQKQDTSAMSPLQKISAGMSSSE